MRLTVEVADEVGEALRTIAAARGVAPAEIVREALALFAGHEAEIERHIAEGRANVASGRFADHGAVTAWLRSWGTDRELPPPACG